jgi:hypothetical protein
MRPLIVEEIKLDLSILLLISAQCIVKEVVVKKRENALFVEWTM